MFWLVFLTAIAFWPGVIDNAIGPRFAVLAVGIPLLLMWHRDGPPRVLGGLGFALLAAVGATIFWAPNLMYGLHDYAHLVILAMAFCLGAAVEDLTEAWRGLAAGVGVSFVVALFQLIEWSPVQQTVPIAGLFVNRNVFAESALVALIPMAFYRRWLWVAVALAAIAVTGSRTTMAAVVLMAAIWYWPTARRLSLMLWAAFICGAWAMFYLSPESMYVRFGFWREAFAGGIPFFGHGFGSFAHDFMFAEYMHSEPLQAVYELGVLAFAPALLVVYLFSRETDGPERFVLAAVLAVGCVSFPLHMPITGFAAALAAGSVARKRCGIRDLRGSHGGTYVSRLWGWGRASA